MNSVQLVAFMEREGWSAAGLTAALGGGVSERTIWRWRRGHSEMSEGWDRTIKALRTSPAKRKIKKRSRWPEKLAAS